MQPETDAERCQLDVLKRGLVLANLHYFDWGSPDVGYGTTLVVKELEPSPNGDYGVRSWFELLAAKIRACKAPMLSAGGGDDIPL
ncbi:MAG: hypothetical protein ABMA00_08985 [Gemmatimonas sp.]